MVKLAGYDGRRTSGSFLAASASAWRWRAPSSTTPRCFCSTNRSAPSTSSCVSRCRTSSRRCNDRSASRFVFVTHDQSEALSMADRVAIFNDGRIVQVGTPQDIYERPASRFIADFVGSSNVLPPEFAAGHGGVAKWGTSCARNASVSSRPDPGPCWPASGGRRDHRAELPRLHHAAHGHGRGYAHHRRRAGRNGALPPR